MTTIYDAVDVAAIPSSATTILAYIDGGYVTYPAVKARFPNARILTITTNGRNRADICDVESGDATPSIAAAGVRAGLYNTVYSALSVKPDLDTALSGSSWQWYAANPTGVPHLVPNSVATQYAWPGLGSPGNYDISVTNGVYPNAAPTPPPAPAPVPPVPPIIATLGGEMAEGPTVVESANDGNRHVFQTIGAAPNETTVHWWQNMHGEPNYDWNCEVLNPTPT